MRVRSAWLDAIAMGSLALAACAPALTDGRYACPDGRCPSGWSCHADRVCRIAAPSDAGTDASAPDAPAVDAQVSYLTPCTRDEGCGGMRCFRGYDDTPWPEGFCTPACRDQTACGALPFSPVCNDLVQACVVLCDETDPDCPPGLQCVGIFREAELPDETLGDCRPIAAPVARSTQETCAKKGDCLEYDETCADMRCARPCIRGVLPCAADEICEASSIGDVCRPM